MDKAHQLLAAASNALGAAVPTMREPGFADRAGALAIGIFVLACWILSRPPGRARDSFRPIRCESMS